MSDSTFKPVAEELGLTVREMLLEVMQNLYYHGFSDEDREGFVDSEIEYEAKHNEPHLEVGKYLYKRLLEHTKNEENRTK